ncbi:unnamed protein product [Ambrosiozyma monospora]|uniref:Unnamed protein product n=1 Tax=Ambrosiozyma monospora TaxID=43982 RepID=A0ACB5TAW9_AMBMO|nr:unnamed protein product [Ambrosiozyma monospora]
MSDMVARVALFEIELLEQGCLNSTICGIKMTRNPKYLKFLEEKFLENFVLKQIAGDEDVIQRLLGMDLIILRYSDGKVKDIKVSQASYIRKFVGDLGIDVDGKKVKTNYPKT